MECNITHNALKKLLIVLNKTSLKKNIPSDPRTLLKTSENIENIRILGDSKLYWHNGLQYCLQKLFWNLDENIDILLNINIDGLPLFNSSKQEFWPILANIHDMPEYEVMVIGIYCGKGKPPSIETFLREFVDEMKNLLQHGVVINGFKLQVGIRCFICDSPARAFLKGIKTKNIMK